MKNLNLGNKIANFASETLEKAANESKSVCFMLFFGEPEYSTDLLLEEDI